jgi:D-alanyl-D-alanine carboxypeptidase
MKLKMAKALISALVLGAIFSAPVLAFDPLRATTIFTNLAADPKLKNPSVILFDASTGEQLFESNGYAMRKPASTLKLLAGVSVAQ